MRVVVVNFIYLSHPKGRDKLNKLKQQSLASPIVANSVHLWSVHLQSVTILTYCCLAWQQIAALARDQLTRPRMSREYCNTRDMVSILGTMSVRERAKRADSSDTKAFLRTINPPTSRMSRIVESREQLTQARPCGNGRPRHGGILPPSTYIIGLRNLC